MSGDPRPALSDSQSSTRKNLRRAAASAFFIAFAGWLRAITNRMAINLPVDLAIIDGPPEALGGRTGTLYQVMDYIRAGGIVLLDDAGHDVGGDRLDIGCISEVRVGHDRRRIGIDQHDPIAFGLERLASLRARIIEFARLPDHDRAGPDDQNR